MNVVEVKFMCDRTGEHDRIFHDPVHIERLGEDYKHPDSWTGEGRVEDRSWNPNLEPGQPRYIVHVTDAQSDCPTCGHPGLAVPHGQVVGLDGDYVVVMS